MCNLECNMFRMVKAFSFPVGLSGPVLCPSIIASPQTGRTSKSVCSENAKHQKVNAKDMPRWQPCPANLDNHMRDSMLQPNFIHPPNFARPNHDRENRRQGLVIQVRGLAGRFTSNDPERHACWTPIDTVCILLFLVILPVNR